MRKYIVTCGLALVVGGITFGPFGLTVLSEQLDDVALAGVRGGCEITCYEEYLDICQGYPISCTDGGCHDGKCILYNEWQLKDPPGAGCFVDILDTGSEEYGHFETFQKEIPCWTEIKCKEDCVIGTGGNLHCPNEGTKERPDGVHVNTFVDKDFPCGTF